MSAIIHKRISFTDSFRSFHQHQRYEDYVFLILQRSKNLFDGTQFTRIKQQSNGECDFLYEDNIKFDVKLLLENSQGRLLGDRKNDVATWVEEMLSEQTEFGNCIGKRDFSQITKTKLYRVMKARMADIKENENAILFSFFPIVEDSKESKYRQFGIDFLQAVYKQLLGEGIIGERKVYFIYPSIDADIYVLRDACYHREYIPAPEIKEIFFFETTL